MTKSKVAIVLAVSLLFAFGAVGVTSASSTLVAKKPCYKVRPIKCQGANLRGKDLKGANLKGANLYEAVLSVATLKGANLKGATMPDGTIHN